MAVNKITTPPNNQDIINKINEIIDSISDSGLAYIGTCPALTPSSGICTWTVTHNLGTTDIVATLYTSGGLEIEKNITIISNNAITVTFFASSNVSAGDYKIVIFASGSSNSLSSNLYYQSGDTFNLEGSINTVGYLSNGRTEISFTIPVPKFLDNITTFTATSVKANIRTVNGTYLMSSSYVSGGQEMITNSISSIDVWKSTNNTISFVITYNSQWENGSNNTPLSLYIHSCSIGLS